MQISRMLIFLNHLTYVCTWRVQVEAERPLLGNLLILAIDLCLNLTYDLSCQNT